jgi:hypothetical protein
MEIDFYCGHHAVTDTNEAVEAFIHDHLNLPNFKSTSIFNYHSFLGLCALKINH